MVTVAIVTALGVAGYVFYLLARLPRVDRLADYKPPIVSQVFGDDGSLVGEFYLERRIVVPVNKMPRKLIQAFVAAEDANFYSHKGIDYFGILRAAFKNLLSMRKKEGASTITQQVTKSMLLTPEKKFSRKIKEAILATRMEEKLSKDEILYLYLNQIYLGGGGLRRSGRGRNLFWQERGSAQSGRDSHDGRFAQGPQHVFPRQTPGQGP